MAHAARVGALAQAQAQGAEHDRLAGAGFPGNGRHAVMQIQIETIDDGVITNGELYQHENLRASETRLISVCLYSSWQGASIIRRRGAIGMA